MSLLEWYKGWMSSNACAKKTKWARGFLTDSYSADLIHFIQDNKYEIMKLYGGNRVRAVVNGKNSWTFKGGFKEHEIFKEHFCAFRWQKQIIS